MDLGNWMKSCVHISPLIKTGLHYGGEASAKKIEGNKPISYIEALK